MANPNPNQAQWFEEFKKANAGATPAPAAKGSDRRRHGRFEVDEASAALYREGLLSKFGVGKGNLGRSALDLSESGARLLIYDRIPPGTRVRVKIEMAKYNDVIEATGVVRWSFQSAKKPSDFFAGIEFVDLDVMQTRKLALMRDWFTSPQYKAMRDTKLRQKRTEINFPR